MSKQVTCLSFKNAEIDTKNMTITEVFDDGIEVYDLREVLSQFDGVSGLGLKIKQETPYAQSEGSDSFDTTSRSESYV